MEASRIVTTTDQSIDEDLKAQLLAEAFKQDWSKYSPLVNVRESLYKDDAYDHYYVSDLYLITPYSVELAHGGSLTNTYFYNLNNWVLANTRCDETIYAEDDPYEVRPDHHYYSVYASLMPGHIYHDPTSPEVQVYTNQGTFEPAKLILGGLKIVRNEKGKYGMADAEGNLRIPYQFDYVDYPLCTDKFALVAKYNKDDEKGSFWTRPVFAVIDANGQEIVPFKRWGISSLPEWVKNRYLRFPDVILDVVEDNIIHLDDKEDQQLFDEGKKYYNGSGVNQDYAMAVFYYRKAADRGHADAQNELGYCYQYGRGVEQSYSMAVRLYQSAAAQGNVAAQNNLGYCYEHGYDVLQSYSKAIKYYGKAAVQGNAMAQCNMGRCFQNGIGVSKSIFKAVMWYRKAAEQGNTDAQDRLDKCNKIVVFLEKILA